MPDTKSIWASKIVWTQIVAMLATAVSYWGFDLPARDQADIVAAILAVQGVVTILWRVFFTGRRLGRERAGSRSDRP